MSTIKKINVLFKDGAAELLHIVGKPIYDCLERLHKILINLLEAVKLTGGTDAEGLITTEAD